MLKITPITYETNSEILFSKLWDLPFSCWLDSGKPLSGYGRYDIMSALPATRLITRKKQTKTYHYQNKKAQGELHSCSEKDPLQLLSKELESINQTSDSPMPFTGGAIGYFSYDLSRRYIDLPKVDQQPTFPEMNVGIYHWALIQDHQLKAAWLINLPECNPSTLSTIKNRLTNKHRIKCPQSLSVDSLDRVISPKMYKKKFQKINDYILAGDCYQVNFAHCFKGAYVGDPYAAYRKLRSEMASPFSAYLQLGEQAIMSLSPERFLQTKGKHVLTQPIKGTIARSSTQDKDAQQAHYLLNDEKNRAENLMIVDLLRNDLGKNCMPGSIKVDELFGLQSFPNVHHLVSSVSGQLDEKSQSLDLFKSSFPGGSITGAPKKRAMQIIDELETGDRGIYCGSIGYINANGDMDTNIAIRTVSCDGKQLYCWGGGGLVADSVAEDEYQESLDKIKRILEVLR